MRWWWFSVVLFGGWDGPLHCWLHAVIVLLHDLQRTTPKYIYYVSYLKIQDK